MISLDSNNNLCDEILQTTPVPSLPRRSSLGGCSIFFLAPRVTHEMYVIARPRRHSFPLCSQLARRLGLDGHAARDLITALDQGLREIPEPEGKKRWQRKRWKFVSTGIRRPHRALVIAEDCAFLMAILFSSGQTLCSRSSRLTMTSDTVQPSPPLSQRKRRPTI
jgi:hypothetical protein